MSDEIVSIVVTCTNAEARNVFGNNWKELTLPELKRYLGLLILAGVYRSNKEPITHLWNKVSGRPIFSKAMARNRFTAITRCLRFDQRETRADRRERDKLAPLREISNMIQRKCISNYRCSSYLCIDEQLVIFRGRCGFKVYMPSKPGRYGIKIWVCADVKTAYCCNFDVYTGRVGRTSEVGQGERVVLQLTEPFADSGRNVTADNFFSTLHLVRALLARRLTFVGTVRKNKPFLPLEFQGPCGMQETESLFAFQKDVTIVKYIPKARRAVTLISSMHHDAALSAESHKKPEIILTYNETKGGVDNLDKLVRTYSCGRKTKRWPVILFANLIDICAYNAFICFIHVHPHYHRNKSHKRRLFLEELALQLIGDLDNDGDENVPIAVLQPVAAGTGRRRKRRCSMCPRIDDKKTPDECRRCHMPICKAHVIRLCPRCSQRE
jgi:hypothetical protein